MHPEAEAEQPIKVNLRYNFLASRRLTSIAQLPLP
jgi:hypothetical protein